MRLDHLGARGGDAGLSRNHLRARSRQRSLGALHHGAIIIELLLWQGVALDQLLGTTEAFLCGCEFSLTLRHHGLRGGLLTRPLGNQRLGGGLRILRPTHLGLSLGQLSFENLSIHARDHFAAFDEVALINVD